MIFIGFVVLAYAMGVVTGLYLSKDNRP